MTPEEYYKEEFNPENWDIVSHLKDNNLFSFNSMVMFAEMYHKSEVEKLNIDDVSNCLEFVQDQQTDSNYCLICEQHRQDH